MKGALKMKRRMNITEQLEKILGKFPTRERKILRIKFSEDYNLPKSVLGFTGHDKTMLAMCIGCNGKYLELTPGDNYTFVFDLTDIKEAEEMKDIAEAVFTLNHSLRLKQEVINDVFSVISIHSRK